MKFLGRGKVCPTGIHEVPVRVMLPDRFLYMCFAAVQVKGWKELTVGHGFNAIAGAAHTNKFFNVAVPGCDLRIAYGPFNAVSITCGGLEFIIAPALAGPPPR